MIIFKVVSFSSHGNLKAFYNFLKKWYVHTYELDQLHHISDHVCVISIDISLESAIEVFVNDGTNHVKFYSQHLLALNRPQSVQYVKYDCMRNYNSFLIYETDLEF